MDATGSVHQVTDNDGAITYTYSAQGVPVTISSSTGQNITIRYNVQGQKIEMNDPSAGTTLYDYNAFGEIIGQQDALGNNTTFEYDEIGRIVNKTIGTYVYEYTYHNQNNHVANNTLTDEKCTQNGTLKHRIQYAYNNKGLLQQTTETLPQQSKTAVTTYTYDGYDRPLTTTYPNIGLQYVYDNYGHMYEIKNSTGTTLWILNAVNAQGLPTQILYGNGQLTTNYYDVHSRLQSILSAKGSTHALNMSYMFNLQTGNLMQRQYNNLNKLEDFNYDNMNRLTTIDKRHTTGNILIDATATAYDAGGNIKAINNGLAQDLAYNTNRPNAVFNHKFETSYSPVFMPNGSTDEHTYTYNTLGKPAELNQQNLKYTIAYGLGEQRVHTKLENSNNLVYETFYLNSASMEIIGNRELTYVYAGGTPFAIHEKNGNDEQLYYLHLDYQGSIRAITDEAGAVVETRDYDAWGRPRNANTLEYTATNPFSVSTITNRGYTFHEHIYEFSLINMNARMYDPVLRRVISPDNLIPEPDNTQAYNRYTYCYNNPLKYIDPDGNEPITLAIILTAKIIAKVSAKVATKKFVSAKVAKVASKTVKISSNIASGTLNAYNNHQQGAPLSHTLVNFAGGYLGSEFGIEEKSDVLGFVVSGGITWANNGYHGYHEDEYDHLQSFVGGGMSSFTGKSIAKGAMADGKQKAAMTTKEKILKYSGKFGSYGAQNWANTFAFDPYDNFLQKSWKTHVGIFAAGGINGVWQEGTKDVNLFGGYEKSGFLNVINDVLVNLPGVYAEAVGTAYAKDYKKANTGIFYKSSTFGKTGKGSAKRLIASILKVSQ